MKRNFITIGIGALVFIAFFMATPAMIRADECTADSIGNYFPRTSIESFVGIPAASITGKGINYSCNGGSLTYNFRLNIGDDGSYYKYKIYVALFKEGYPTTAHNRYLEQSDISYNSAGVIKSDQRTKVPLGIGDESTLITNPDYGNGAANPGLVVDYLGVARKGNAVFVVRASVVPNGNGMPPSLASKFNASNVSQEIKYLLSQAAKEPDRYSQTATPGPSVGRGGVSGATSCPQTSPYFPLNRVESIFGKKIGVANEFSKGSIEKLKKIIGAIDPNNSLFSDEPVVPGTLDWAACYIYFGSVSGQVSQDQIITSFTKMDSVENAHAMIAGLTTSQNAQATLLGQENIGDEGSLYKITGNYIGYEIIVRKGVMTFAVIYVNLNDKVKAEALLRMAAGDNQSSPTGQPSPSTSTKVTDLAPIIDSVSTSPTSAVLSAGKEFFHDQIGIVTFVDNNLILVIKGKNLKGATLKTDNIGLDGKSGIEFQGIRVSADRTMVAAQTTIKPTAKEGDTILTFTNSAGKSATAKIDILITGTQYLQRKFADNNNIRFFGDWPDYMPYQRVLNLEKSVKNGLQAINKNTYNKLGIMIQIYETNSWSNFQMAKYCPLSFMVVGCASPADRIIYIGEFTPPPGSNQTVEATVLHESAHKLHFYYEGSYIPVPSTANSFDKEWKSVLGNLKSCSYLPLLKDNSWSDRTKRPFRCGFDWSYGAYRVQDLVLPKFYEDVATLTETSRLNPARLNEIKASGDPRYIQKTNLLDKYDF